MIARFLGLLAIAAGGLFAQQGSNLAGIVPSSVAAGSSDFQMQLNGAFFCANSFAVFVQSATSTNGSAVNLSTQFVSSGQLMAVVPATLVAQPRVANIYVDNRFCDRDNTNSVVFTVGPPVAILPDTILSGNVGSPYTVQFQGVNGNVPYTWALITTLNGFTMDTVNGILTGTPTQTGDYPFSIQVSDRYLARATRSYVLHVEPPALDISPTRLPNGIVNVPYDQFLKAIGGVPPFQFFFQSGNIPPGLAFKSDNSGEIIGTPTVAGTFSFTANVRDSAQTVASRNITIVIDSAKTTISPDTIPSGTAGVFYSQTFIASGGTTPYSWSILSLNVDGFRIDSSTGVFTGSTATPGTYTLTIQAIDKNGSSTQKTYSLVINSSLAITTASLPDGVVGTVYPATTLQATGGGTARLVWGIASGALPDGLNLDAASGQIAGTPTKAGTFNVTIRVTTAATGAPSQTASKDFRIVVTQPVTPLSITTTSLPQATVGTAYSATLQATGGTPPYSFVIVARSLPPGLSLEGKTGIISGTPTTPGPFSVGFGVIDSASKTATADINIGVVGKLSLSPTSLPAATVGVAYTQTLTASGGVAPYKFAATLPAGFTLNATTGVLTGTPTTTDPINFTVALSDSFGAVFTSPQYTIQVNLPPLPAVTIGGLPATSPPASQPSVTVTLADVFPVDVTGVLTLTFASAVGGSDDTIQFTTGGRTAAFRITAGSKTAVFSAATVGVVTGTVAGTITVTTALTAGGGNVTPSPAPVQRIVIDQGAPVLTKVVLNTTSTGYEVLVTGYTTTRSMVRGTFTFTPTSGGTIQTTSFQVALNTAFTTWFNSAASNATGGQFTLTMPFTTSGPTGAVASVSVVLNNARGDSNPRASNQ